MRVKRLQATEEQRRLDNSHCSRSWCGENADGEDGGIEGANCLVLGWAGQGTPSRAALADHFHCGGGVSSPARPSDLLISGARRREACPHWQVRCFLCVYLCPRPGCARQDAVLRFKCRQGMATSCTQSTPTSPDLPLLCALHLAKHGATCD